MAGYEQTTTSRGKKHSSRSTNFSVKEDEALCASWIYVNEDPLVGAGQRVAQYWGRILQSFKARVGDDNTRSKDSITTRFGHIQKACNRWAGIISTIERTTRSGTTMQDRYAEAKSTYHLTHGSQFLFEHCWNILKESPKWNESLETRSSTMTSRKRGNIILDVEDEFTPTSPSPTVGLSPIDPFLTQVGDGSSGGGGSESGSGSSNKKKRPLGTKAAKERLKRGADNSQMMEKYLEQMTIAAADRAELLRLKKWKEDNKILLKETSNLPPEIAEYFENLKIQILQQRQAGGGGVGGSSGDGGSNT